MDEKMTKPQILRATVNAALAVLVLFAALIFMYAMARMWVIGKAQAIMMTTTVGTSIKQTESYLGPPIYEQTKSQWQTREHADAVMLPEGTERIVVYLILGGNYCYVFLNSDGFILGSYWFFT